MHIVAKGIVTEHGLSVSDPMAKVLRLKDHHRCETLWQIVDSGLSSYGFIRCWVGPEPARLRYVASLGERWSGGDLGGLIEHQPDPPSSEAALERWIASAKEPIVIDQIIWHAAPAGEY